MLIETPEVHPEGPVRPDRVQKAAAAVNRALLAQLPNLSIDERSALLAGVAIFCQDRFQSLSAGRSRIIRPAESPMLITR